MNKGPPLTDLNDVPHKIQYITIDSVDLKPHTGSEPVRTRHTPMTLDLDLYSNIHFEGMSQVIGLKIVDAYFMQIGGAGDRDGGVARLVDIVCPQIPTAAQLLTTRGHVFARCPLEENAVPTGDDYKFDKQVKLMTRKTNYFNPISIKKLDFSFYELGANDVYQGLQNSREWTITLEITTLDKKEKPINKDQQMLQLLQSLLVKMDSLNENVRRLPDNPPEEQKKKYPFGLLVLILVTILGGFIWSVNRSTPSPSVMQ